MHEMMEVAMEQSSENKLKSYHLEQQIIQMNQDHGIKMAEQKQYYNEIILDHKNAIE